jgi:hypothetical protein
MSSRTINTNTSSLWAPENSFEELKRELMKVDPVYFAESYLTLDGKPMKLTGNGWKFIADIYRHIMTSALSVKGRPIVIVKGRQVGATTMASSLELNMVAGGMFGQGGAAPIRVMHAFPQLELMHAFSKDKLEKMIRESIMIPDSDNPKRVLRPFIETRKDGSREASDSLTYKQFLHGNTLWCDSIGNEGVRVRGRTIDAIFFDEAQLMTKQAISTAVKCLTRAQYGPQPGGVQVYFGTPEHKQSYFYEMWEASDQRRYYLGCAECRRYFLLYTPGSDLWDKEIWLYENVVRCPNCGHEQNKIEAIERGKWLPTPGKEDAKFVGFHFNQLFIPEFHKEVILRESPVHNPMKREVDWNNEVLGEFHSGTGLPITREEIYKACRDPARALTKQITKDQKKMVYMGVDWGGKPDIDGVSTRGQSFSCVVVISVEHDGRVVIEFAQKLKKLDLKSKIQFVEEMYRLYNVRLAAADVGYAEDISGELKTLLGDRFKTVRNSAQVLTGTKYREDELEIVIDKDKWIGDMFSLLRRGGVRFPWGSYERIAWLVDHCCSMESKQTIRQGMPHTMFTKGKTQNDGLMALINAYVAYKFEQTRGFKVNPGSTGAKAATKPVLAYLPRMR